MEEKEEQDKKGISFIFKIIAILIIILILLMIIPSYIIPINTKFYYDRINDLKKDIDNYFEDVNLTTNISFTNFNQINNYFYSPQGESDLTRIRAVSTKIISFLCDDYDKECYTKALFYFIRDYINYVNDPVAREYIQNPLYTLKIKSGDCDDHALLFSLMLYSIGIKNELIFSVNHVYNKVHIIKKAFFKEKEVIKELDTTCKSCEFD